MAIDFYKYSRLEKGPTADEWAAPMSAFLAARSIKEKERVTREEQERRWAEQERRERRDAQIQDMEIGKRLQDQQQYMSKARQAATAKLARGDVEGARAMLSDVPWFDGQGNRGIGLSIGETGRPQQPVAPPEVTDNLNFMLRAPYKGSKTGGDPAGSAPGEGNAGRPDLAELMEKALVEGRETQRQETRGDQGLQGAYKRFQAEEAAFPAAQAAYEANPRWRISGGPSPPSDVSLMGARSAMQGQRELDAEELAKMVMKDPNPWVQKYGPMLTDAVAGGGMERDEFMKYLVMLRDNDMDAEMKLKGMDEAMKRARVSASARGRGQDNSERRTFYSVFKDWKAEMGIDHDIKGYIRLKDDLRKIGSKNPLDINGVKMSIAREMQGSGVLSNQDFTKTVEGITGVLGSAESWLQRAKDGNLSQREIKVIAEAIQHTIADSERRFVIAGRAYDRRFGNSQWDSARQDVDDVRASVFGNIEGQEAPAPSRGNSRGKPSPIAAGKQAGRKKPVSQRSDEELLGR